MIYKFITTISMPLQLKKSLVAFVALGLIGFNSYAQADQVISGGNTVSSFVCSNRKAYTWGAGSGTPVQINFPGNVDIRQINSGSGSTFVALDCNGDIWAWGNNKFGQVGNGTTGGTVASPVRVKADPSIAASNRNGSGELTNVSVVYGGNNNSYAILTNGRLVGWGHNSTSNSGGAWDDNTGQLGDGTNVDKTAAVYVIDGTTNLPITGVTQIFAGDNVSYCLANGVVYSWGNGLNGTLGRDATGTSNPGSGATVTSNKAYPVRYANGSIMNNITDISCGDVFGMALDVDGYVWTWGNGAWNNSTGNTTTNYTGSDPKRVLKGTTTGASNDGTYLLAKSIGGGQGFGMAVTVDGKPVAWGGGGCAGGGATGNGTVTGSGATGVGYVMRTGGVIDNTAISVSRGDLWGYYRTANNDIYAWGCNSQGQLGIGNTVDQAYAVKMTPPAGCGLRDPEPDVKLRPGDTTVCQSKFTSLTLNSGFVPQAGLGSQYEVKWFKDDVVQKTGTAATDLTYSATTKGEWKVEIKYIGNNAGCMVYPVAKDSMILDFFPQTFTVPTNLTYCGKKASVKVNSTTTTNPGYDWFATALSTTSLGTTYGSTSDSIDISGITAAGNGDKCVYVEEKSYASGTVFKKNQGKDGAWSSMDFLNNGAQTNTVESGFTISEPLTLTTTNIHISDELYNVGNSQSVTMTFGVYGSKTNNGGLVADDANKIGTFTFSFNRTRAAGNPQIYDRDELVNINIKLPSAGTYFLSLDNLTGVTGNVKIGKGSSSGQTAPIGDDVTGNFIKFTNSSVNNNPQTGGNLNQGNFFNVKFKTDQHYCDRVQVCIKQSCPCQQPSSVTANSTPAHVSKVVSVCPGTAISLTGTYVAGSNPLTDAIRFVWYKKGTTPGAYSLAPVTAKNLTGIAADEGTWVLRVEDGSVGNASCYKEDTIKVVLKTLPAVTNMTSKVCSGTAFSVTPVNGTDGVVPTGTTYTWTAPAGTGFSGGSAQAVAQTSIGQTLTNTAASGTSTATYTVTPSVNGCPGATFTVTVDLEHTVDAAVSGNPASTCATSYQLGATAVTNGTGTWTVAPSAGMTFAPSANDPAAVASTMTKNTAYTFTWTVSNGAGHLCPDKTSTVTITQAGDITSATPVSAQSKTICENDPAPLLNTTAVGTLKAGETGVWSATAPASITVGGQTGNLQIGDNIFKYTITTTVPGCAPSEGIVTIKVLPLPGAAGAITGSLSVCAGAAGVTYSVPAVSGVNFNWKRPAGSTVTSATSDSSSITVTFGNTPGNFDFVATPKNSCGTGTPSTFTVNVKPNLTPTITIDGSDTICAGSNATFFIASASDSGATPAYKWYVDANLQASTGTTFSSTTLVDGNKIKVEMTSSEGCKTAPTATSNIMTIVVVGMVQPKVTLTPSYACAGVAQTITAQGQNAGAPGTATYEWKLNSGIVQTGNSTTYTSSTFANGDLLEVTMTSTLSCAGPSKIASTSVIIDVKPIPTATSSSVTICSGTKAVIQLSSNTSGTTFDWTSSADPNITGHLGGKSTPTDSTISQTLTSTLSAPGDVTYTVTPSTAFCPGTPFTVKATVNPIPNVIATNDSICNGEVTDIALTSDVAGATFKWTATAVGATGQSADNTGTLTNIAQTLNNSGSTLASVSYVVTATYATCPGAAKTVIAYVKPTPTVANVTPPAICSGDKTNITLTSSVSTTTTFGWTAATADGVSGFVSPNSASKIDDVLMNNNTADGVVTYNVIAMSQGCIGPVTNIAITVKPIPVLTITATDPTICGGNDPGIDVQSNVAGSTYSWTMATGGSGTVTKTGASSETDIATGALAAILNNTSSSSGTATFTMTPKANGCIGGAKNITITVNPSPDAKLLSGTLSICSGETTDLSIGTSIANIPVTFDWTATGSNVTGFAATGTSSNIPTSIAETLTNSGTSNETVTYTITPSGGGCIGQPLDVIQTVKPIPSATAVNNKPAFCSGDATSIDITSTTPGTTFSFSAASISGNASGHSSSTGATIAQTLTANVTSLVRYTITPTASGCVGTPVTEDVTVYEIPASDAGTDVSFCDGDSAKIGGNSNSAYTYLWSPSANLDDDTLASPLTTATTPTTYIVETSLRAFGACKTTDTVEVNVSPKFSIDAGPDVLTCANEPTLLTASPAGLPSYIWRDSIEGQVYTGEQITIQTNNNNKYYLVATNSVKGGCTATDSVAVRLKNDFKATLFIPNAFTPNADGVNEIFQVGAFGVEEFEGMIFNRWGEKIYTWNDVNGGWDGKINGNYVQQDVYIVAIRVKNVCDEDFNDFHRGTVTVIR
ncbi:MAG: PKD-like domain-containing protein [Flavobacteriales bacterium]